MQRLVDSPALRGLDLLVGEWTIEVPNPPGGLDPVRGTTSFAWMKGGVVLEQRAAMESPIFPDAVAFYGADAETGRLVVHSWDSRGVARQYGVSVEDGVFRQWRDLVEGESFAQRLTLTLSDDGTTLAGPVEMARDGVTWQHDMDFVFRRVERS
jgi:hypothetical protein